MYWVLQGMVLGKPRRERSEKVSNTFTGQKAENVNEDRHVWKYNKDMLQNHEIMEQTSALGVTRLYNETQW